MPDNKNFVPRVDGTGSLGRSDKKWNTVYSKNIEATEDISTTNLTASGHVSASVFYGDGSNLTGIATGSSAMGGTMTAHIIPDTNALYDLGNAEYKIRHLFLSDNSLWVGDKHKVSIQNGKMKFKKRNGAPQELKDALNGVNLEVDTAATDMYQNNLLDREGVTEDDITLEELHIMAAHYGLDPLTMFTETNMDSDFNDDLVELSRAETPQDLPDASTLEYGTMIYDTTEHKVKVVSPDLNGNKSWKTLDFE